MQYRALIVFILFSFGSTSKPDPVTKKFEDLSKQTKRITTGWHDRSPEHLLSKLNDIPTHIKNKTRHSIPEVLSVLPVSHLGGCGRKVAAQQLGVKRSPKAARLWKQKSLMQLQSKLRGGSLAPEHPGRESFAIPGAGTTQTLKDEGRSTTGSVDGQEAYVTVLKDGFFQVGCFHDAMLSGGDKFGNDADKYKMDYADVAIAKYDELILDENKEAMTPTVCFEFCRSLPDMVFFGIADGRTCYCMPYYVPRPGDEEQCNANCPGDQTLMCGNMKGKSSIFEMHLCDDIAQDLAAAMDAAGQAMDYFMETALLAQMLGDKMTASGKALEKVGGLSGAPGAADNAMKAQSSSKALTQAFMPELANYEKCLTAYGVGKDSESADMGQSSNAIAAEHATKTMKATVGSVVTGAAAAHAKIKLAYPVVDQVVFRDAPDGGDAAAMKLKSLVDGEDQKEADFRVASYAFDTTYVPAQSSCTGALISLPMVGLGKKGCALACEATVYPAVCVGYSFYTLTGADDLCFMFSEIYDVETFTGPEPALLQKGTKADADPAAAYCGIKMSQLTTGYKPAGEWKKTSRDFGGGSLAIGESITEYSVPDKSSLKLGAVEVKKHP